MMCINTHVLHVLLHEIAYMRIRFYSQPIPVKPFIAKYLQHNKIRKHLLPVIYSFLSKDMKRVTDMGLNLDEYSETVKLQLPEHIFICHGYAMSKRNVIIFNTLLEGEIKEKFEQELLANIRTSLRLEVKFEIQDMIIDLREEFGLNETDMSFEMIKKMLYRFCQSENVDIQCVKNFRKSVPKKVDIIRTNPHYIRSDRYRELLRVSTDTLTRMIKKGEVHVERSNGWYYVDLTRSKLPPGYTLAQA